jgi:hypothetical protein
MNGMSGTDRGIWGALSGLDSLSMPNPGRCPVLVWICPFGAQQRAIPNPPTERIPKAPTERIPYPPTERIPNPPTERIPKAPTERLSKAPTGRPYTSPGQRPGLVAHANTKALKGRPNRNGGDA